MAACRDMMCFSSQSGPTTSEASAQSGLTTSDASTQCELKTKNRSEEYFRNLEERIERLRAILNKKDAMIDELRAKNRKLEQHAEAIRFLRAEERERWSLKVKELTDESNKYHRLYQELLNGGGPFQKIVFPWPPQLTEESWDTPEVDKPQVQVRTLKETTKEMQQPVEKTRCHPYPAAGPFVKKKNSYRPQRPARASEKATQDHKGTTKEMQQPVEKTRCHPYPAAGPSVEKINSDRPQRPARASEKTTQDRKNGGGPFQKIVFPWPPQLTEESWDTPEVDKPQAQVRTLKETTKEMQQPVEKTRCHPYPAAGPFVKKKNSYRPQRPARASEKATQDRKEKKCDSQEPVQRVNWRELRGVGPPMSEDEEEKLKPVARVKPSTHGTETGHKWAWMETWRKLLSECTSQGTGLNSNTDLATTS